LLLREPAPEEPTVEERPVHVDLQQAVPRRQSLRKVKPVRDQVAKQARHPLLGQLGSFQLKTIPHCHKNHS